MVAPTSSTPSTSGTTTVVEPTTTTTPEPGSDLVDDEFSVGLLLSEFGFGQQISLPIGVGAGKAEQAVSQQGLAFGPGGDFSSVFIISGNGDLSEDVAVLTDSFTELVDADIDVLLGPVLGADLAELTAVAADAGVPFAASGYVNDGSISTQGTRFDIAGSVETHLTAVVRQVVFGEFDSIVVVGSDDDDLGGRLEQLLQRNGSSASVELMPAAGDLGEVRLLAGEVAERGARVAIVMATATNAVAFIDAVTDEPNGRNAVFFGLDSVLSQSMVASVGSLSEGQVVVVRRSNDAARPEQADFLARVRENNPDLLRPFDAADSYDMYVLAALAVVDGGDASPASIRDRIIGLSRDGEPCAEPAECLALLETGADIDYDGVSGPIEFDDDGVSTATWFAIDVADANGQLVTSGYELHSLDS